MTNVEFSHVACGKYRMGQLTLLQVNGAVQNWLLLVLVLGMLGLVTILIIYNKKSNEKARNKTTQWAVENGLQLLEFEPRSGPGPFGRIRVSRGTCLLSICGSR